MGNSIILCHTQSLFLLRHCVSSGVGGGEWARKGGDAICCWVRGGITPMESPPPQLGVPHDIIAAFVSPLTLSTNQPVACLLPESGPLCSAARQQPRFFARRLAARSACQPVRKQDAVVVSDNTPNPSHTERSTVGIMSSDISHAVYFCVLLLMCTHTVPCHYMFI